MKKWKLIAIISSILIVVAAATTLIIIFTHHANKPSDEQKYQYPSTEPSISDPNGTFMKLGNRNLTNLEVYNTGILSYGLNVLNDLIDVKLLADVEVSDQDLIDHKRSIYATYNSIDEDEVDFTNEEQKKTFQEQMIRQGYLTEKAQEDAIALDAKRTIYAKSVLEAMIKNYVATEDQPLYYTTAQIKQAISSVYPEELKAVVLIFRSEAEANKLLKAVGVDSEKVSNGWCDLEGNNLSKQAIIEKFIQMADLMEEESITEAKSYLQSDLSSISTTISNYLFNTATPINSIKNDSKLIDAYTTKPKKYLTGYYYLALSIEKTSKITPEEYMEAVKNQQESEMVKEISDKLFDLTFVSTMINAILYEHRGEWGIEIYDERLDYEYANAANSLKGVLAGAKYPYQMITNESSEYVAKLSKDVKTITVTADELYQELSERYGILVAIQYMNFYLFYREPYSSVYNYETKAKGANFTEEYQEKVLYLKEQLEAGDFAEQGFDANYGWEHFLRDYFGATDLDEAILVGDIYSEAINRFDESLLTIETEEARSIYDMMMEAYIYRAKSISEYEEYVASLDPETYEMTILYQIVKNFLSYYYVNATYLAAYYDKNGDNKADDLTPEAEASASTIVEAFYYIAKVNPQKSSNVVGSSDTLTLVRVILDALNSGAYSPLKVSGTTIAERLESLVNLYNKASITDTVFGSYKVQGLRFKMEMNIASVDSGSDNAVDQAYREAWQMILRGGLILDNGHLAEFSYAEQVNSAVTALNATGFDNDQYTIPATLTLNNQVIKTYITGAVNATWYRYTSTLQDLAPDTERLAVLITYYELSLKEELTEEEEKTYHKYSPATFEKNYLTNTVSSCYEYLLSDDLMQEVVYQLYQKYLGDETFQFSRAYMKDECLQFMEIVYTK